MTNKTGLHHLHLRFNKWTYRRALPEHLRHINNGLRLYSRSLGTSDVRIAKRRRDEINQMLDGLDSQSPAVALQARIAQLKDHSSDDLDQAWSNIVDQIAPAVYGHNQPDSLNTTEVLKRAGVRPTDYYALAAARGVDAGSLPNELRSGVIDAADAYFKATTIIPGTKQKYQFAVNSWLEFKGHQDAGFMDTTRAEVNRFLGYLSDQSVGTRKGKISCLSIIWRHTAERSEDYQNKANPFKGLRIGAGSGKNGGKRQSYEFIEDGVLAKILDGMNDSAIPAIWCRHSGLRIGEVFNLRPTDIIQVDGVWCFDITQGKTATSVRKVPIHENILSEVLRFKQGHRLWECKSAHLYANQFSKSKVALGYPRATSLHSTRVVFITLATRAGHSELEVAQVVGHKAGATLTGKLYNKGFEMGTLQDVVNSVPAYAP
jgi:integrase